ncbi:hypothetical protein N431DRAFT_497489 [Stipitochalara longipes BDJ]|nr:hypothetical protein N431DRAFT_497489 [Stipitochalara longipes BDJ]
MSDNQQPSFSDLEGSDVDNNNNTLKDNNNGKLHDPTGQYANAYARAGKAIPPSSPTLNPSPPPQQTVQKHPCQPSSQVPFPEPYHSYRSSNASPGQDSIAFSYNNGHQEHSHFYKQPRVFRAPARYQGPAVARVVSRHILPAQPSRTRLDNITEFEPLREPLYDQPAHRFQSPSQYSIQPGDTIEFEHASPCFVPHTPASAPFASEPLAKRYPRRRSFASQHNFSDFEQSPPPSVQSSYHQRSTSIQYQDPSHEGLGPSREIAPYDNGYVAEGHAAVTRHAKRGYESIDDDSESGIFVKVNGRQVVPAGSAGNPPKSRKRFSQDSLLSYDQSSPRPQPGQRPDDEYFNNPGKNLAQSRFAGGQNNWGVNKVPVLVPEDEVTDAALVKRGLKRGDGARVCKRGYGANDPENIAIVNMFEKDRMSFDAICNKLNADRIANGKAPTLTPNGCQTRFNRNAPILFSAEGRDFIPLGLRQRGQRMDDIAPTNPRPKVAWDDELDLALVETVKEWESRKWEDVATLFKRKTGVDMDAGSCAHRHHII